MPTVARRPFGLPIQQSQPGDSPLLLGHRRHHRLKTTTAEAQAIGTIHEPSDLLCYVLSCRVFVVRSHGAAARLPCRSSRVVILAWFPFATPHEEKRKDHTNRLTLCSTAFLHCDCRPFLRTRCALAGPRPPSVLRPSKRISLARHQRSSIKLSRR
jgi:hypothetical protein